MVWLQSPALDLAVLSSEGGALRLFGFVVLLEAGQEGLH